MSSQKLTIGRLAKLTGVPPKTIRYYEEAGILPAPERSASRYRLYSDTDVRRLELIRRARLLDMTLSEVQELLKWAGASCCGNFQDRFLEVVRRKREEVDRRIADMRRLEQDLLHLEAHFSHAGEEVKADHTMLECSRDACRCLGEKGRESGMPTGGDVMAGEARLNESTKEEQRRDCGCGCGGAACSAGQHEAVWAEPPKATSAAPRTSGQAGCDSATCTCCV